MTALEVVLGLEDRIIAFEALPSISFWTTAAGRGSALAPARALPPPSCDSDEYLYLATASSVGPTDPSGRFLELGENHLGCPSQVGGPDRWVRPLLMLDLVWRGHRVRSCQIEAIFLVFRSRPELTNGERYESGRLDFER